MLPPVGDSCFRRCDRYPHRLAMKAKVTGGVLIVAASVVATILLNLALLGYAEPHNDPVGKLSPRAVILHAPRTRVRHAPPPRRQSSRENDD